MKSSQEDVQSVQKMLLRMLDGLPAGMILPKTQTHQDYHFLEKQSETLY